MLDGLPTTLVSRLRPIVDHCWVADESGTQAERRITMGKRLYVGNLSYSTTEADLRDAFAAAGEVAEVKVVLDRDTGRPRGFAFVEMATEAAAQSAMETLNGKDLQGRTIAVSEARERSGGGGGGRGGFGGGHGGHRGGGDRDGFGGGRRQRW
jgi:cold-inducible RNA-binding protein